MHTEHMEETEATNKKTPTAEEPVRQLTVPRESEKKPNPRVNFRKPRGFSTADNDNDNDNDTQRSPSNSR